MPLGEIRHDPRNARLHPERNLEAISASLLRFGQQKPIVISQDGVCVAGNGTLEAARRLGWTHLAAVRTQLPEPARRAFAIADNRAGELAAWDELELAAAIDDLQSEISLDAMGFDADDLDAFRAPKSVESGVDGRAAIARASKHKVRVVLSIAELQEFERIVRITGRQNRGEAIMEIVRRYAEGQSDRSEKGMAPPSDAGVEAELDRAIANLGDARGDGPGLGEVLPQRAIRDRVRNKRAKV